MRGEWGYCPHSENSTAYWLNKSYQTSNKISEMVKRYRVAMLCQEKIFSLLFENFSS